MKQININNAYEIDLSKALENDKTIGLDETSDEWKNTFSDSEFGISTVIGLNKFQDKQLAKKLLRNFIEDLKHHKSNVIFIERKTLVNVLGDENLSIKDPKNLWTVDYISQNEELQELASSGTEEGISRVIHLTLPLKDLLPEHLTGSSFIVLKVGETPIGDNLDQARMIIQHGNQNDIPVWCYDKRKRREILQREGSHMNSVSSGVESIYFDLPQHCGYQFIDNDEATEIEAKDLGDSIIGARNRAMIKELEAGYRLYLLDNLARANGKAQFWRQNLNVKNRSEFCRLELGLPGNLGTQYLKAVRNIEILKPGFLEKFFDSESEFEGALPHGYTRYRDLHSHILNLIELKNHPRYIELEDMIFDPDMSGRQLQQELKLKIDEFIGVEDPEQDLDGSVSIEELPDDGGSAMQDQEETIRVMNIHDAPDVENSLSAEDIIEKFKYDFISLIPEEFSRLLVDYCEVFHSWVKVSKGIQVDDSKLYMDPNDMFDDRYPWELEGDMANS